MKIKGMLTERNIKNFRSFQLVYEWEDIISEQLQIPVYKSKKLFDFFFRNINRIRLGWLFLFIDYLRPVSNYYLHFDMEATSYLRLPCAKNIIPIYIDFWLKQSGLKKFEQVHSNSKLVLVTSKEVYELLKKNKSPLPVVHFPLSLPDKYISLDKIKSEKKIDFLFAGRIDPVFFEYIKLYEKQNPRVEYVYQELKDGIAHYISNKRGKLPGNYDSRQHYSQLLQYSKVAFYTTPGNDAAKEGANGYNQVTPRFLELISHGCLVMARYTENADVAFYNLQDICFKIDSYQGFLNTVQLFSDEGFVSRHINKYYSYLKMHSTSSRAAMLRAILRNNSFRIKTNESNSNNKHIQSY